MARKQGKHHQKKLLRKLRRQQRKREAAMPLTRHELLSLCEWVEAKLKHEGCDHSYRYTEAFLRNSGLPVQDILDWLSEEGGYCDCEVIANVKQVYEESVFSPFASFDFDNMN